MESNNLIRFASIEAHKESQIGKEENLEPRPECCVYRVPKELRRVNAEAYTPKVISIGPLHHDNQEFAYMERQKIRYKREFSKRITPEIWEELVSFIQNHEQRIRNCYEEITSSNLQKQLEFVTMILYDSVFILELFLRFSERNPLKCRPRLGDYIDLDLLMLENQLPYFVLEELFRIAFPKPTASLLFLSCAFFDIRMPIDSTLNVLVPDDEVEIKHFTDLKRHVLKMTYRPPLSKCELFTTPDIPCALKLQESGMKFKQFLRGGLLDIKFEKNIFHNIIPFSWFKANELHIPEVKIYDETESLLRNLMALEQCHYPEETYICNYINLMDSLINSEEDVNLLAEAGIISCHVGDNVKVAKMFNNICQHISLDDNCYRHIFKELKAHHANPWNHLVAPLKRVYFNNLWRGTATFAATLLLILTFIQTVYSIL